MRLLWLIFLLFIYHLAFAEDKLTIYDSSVIWDNASARAKLLESSAIPQWDNGVINHVYDIYSHPEQHKLPPNKNSQKYNTTFLDAYWGPVINPFVKYARPAKIFVYEGLASKSHMSVIIKNAADNNFYVFNRDSNKPQLLVDWVNEIKATQASTYPLKFNICNGYGNLPADTCIGNGYQDEESFALSGKQAEEHGRIESNYHLNTAYRSSSQDWHAANSAIKHIAIDASDSILKSSVDWNNMVERNKLLNTTATWPNYKNISSNFEKLRDIRYFNDEQKNDFLRRISWLYPDDGCWTRASAMINHLFGTLNNSINQAPRPSKVFAFGNLCVNTTNHPEGRVNWWYHTAPLVRDAETNQVYVLDPSISPGRPMMIEDWMIAISASTGACKNDRQRSYVEKFNVCTGFGTSPGSACSGGNVNFASEAYDALRQDDYRMYERKRQIELGRDPDNVLGDQAPWM